MKVYRVFNSYMTADGSTSIEECGVFASETIANMVQKALDTYNLEMERLANTASDDVDEAGNLKGYAIVSRQAITEVFEINESLEQIEETFKTIQKRIDKERKLYSEEQV